MFLSVVLPRKEIKTQWTKFKSGQLQPLQHNCFAGHHQEQALDKVLKMAMKARLKVWLYCMTWDDIKSDYLKSHYIWSYMEEYCMTWDDIKSKISSYLNIWRNIVWLAVTQMIPVSAVLIKEIEHCQSGQMCFLSSNSCQVHKIMLIFGRVEYLTQIVTTKACWGSRWWWDVSLIVPMPWKDGCCQWLPSISPHSCQDWLKIEPPKKKAKWWTLYSTPCPWDGCISHEE